MEWVDGDANVYGRATGIDRRGRHRTSASAFDAALKDLLTEKNPFFNTVATRWPTLFPDLPAKPGRSEDGKIFLYVRHAPALFLMRPKLRKIAATLATLPGAPKKVDLHLEIHAAKQGGI